jgi:hypothetical protein
VPLQKYIDASRKLDVSDIPWERVRDYPLDDRARDCLIFMSDIEGFTIGYLHDLLNTSAINDPEISRFMTLWGYEELFHQDAILRFLSEYGVSLERERLHNLRKGTSLADRVMMNAASAASYITPDFLAAYMTWGAINEASAAAGYALLAERARHPILSTILGRIVKDEWRHHSFYFQQARARLRASALARLLATQVVRALWRPVGNGVKNQGQLHDAYGYCFGGGAGREALRGVDVKIQRLPGFGWFRKCEAFMDELEQAGAAR